MRSSIYKRGRRSSSKTESKWTIEYELASGRMKTERAYTDKQASLQLLRQREREVAQGIQGLTDRFREHKQLPIDEHIAAYNREQAGRGVSAEHQQRCRNRLQRAFRAMGARTIVDLNIGAARDYVTGLVTDEGKSLTTRNHYSDTLRQFGQWLLDGDKLPGNPLAKLENVAVTDADRTHEARVFTVQELQAVCAVAKPHHRLIYLFTAYTGFRHSEDKSVTWADLSIDTAQPTCTLRDTKNGQRVVVNLPSWLAGELRRHRAEETLKLGGKLPLPRRVLHIPRRMVHHLRRDAAKAGLGAIEVHRGISSGGHRYTGVVKWVDPLSPKIRLDFHDLRAFYATLLFENNVALHEVKRLCRHASITTTEKHYTAWREARLRDTVDRLPSPLTTGPSVPASVDGVPKQSGADRSGPAPQPSPRRVSR